MAWGVLLFVVLDHLEHVYGWALIGMMTCSGGVQKQIIAKGCLVRRVTLLSDTTFNKYLPWRRDTATPRDQSHAQGASSMGMVPGAVLPVRLHSFCVAKQ